MDAATATGIGASLLSAVSMLPQLITIIRTKEADGISYFAVAILLAGLGLWVAYGVQKKDVILIVANSVSILINASVLVAAIVLRKK